MAFQYNGLTSDKVEKSREKHGSNAITRQEKTTFWNKLSENLKDPMIIILIVALGIVTVLAAGGYAKWYEGIGIAVAVILATIVSTAAEYKNEKTFQKLQEEASRIKINVFRDGSIRQVDIDDIVVGDIILLQAGDKIPSDGWIIDGSLKINQAMFTGEAAAVYKNAADEPNPEPELSDGRSVFRGTTVEDGEGVMQVETVGDKTRFGELSFQLATEERKGPLRIKLANLAKGIAKFAYIGAIFIALSFIFKVVFLDNQFETAQIMAYLSDWHKVLYDAAMAAILAVIIIVVAVPEGLPMMIAIVLAQNMKKLLNAKVLVRQLMGIETSGSLNILFCDKTGTITRGELQAIDFFMVSKNFDSNNQNSNSPDYVDFENVPDTIRELLDMALRETSSTLINPDAKKEKEKLVGGNATERTLLKFIGADIRKPVYDPDSVELIQQITFNTDRKFSASRINRKNEKKLTLVKGAPEKVLEASEAYYDQNGDTHRFDSDLKNKVFDKLEESSQKGYRMMAIAAGDVELEDEDIYELPSGLSILGFVSIRDEIRPEAPSAIEKLIGAGVRVVMLTGDKTGTARSIARETRLLESEDDWIVESKELNELSDDRVIEKLDRLKVIARCLPRDKKRLVKLAQDVGYVVGMTGDGVNDAPALSNADVGFAMGSGSEVSKEAAEIVILDDNIESIANAVHYGRTIYRSIQKFIVFQLTVNVSAILVAFIGPFIGYRLPLTMIQLLWINLIMDTLAALSLSGEPPLPKHMKEQPKKREEPIITRQMWAAVFIDGIFIAACCILFLKLTEIRSFFSSPEAFLTGFFGYFVFVHNFNRFNSRVDGLNLFHHILSNKTFLHIFFLILGIQILLTYFGGEVFRTVPLTVNEFLFILGFSILVIPFDLLRKMIFSMARPR